MRDSVIRANLSNSDPNSVAAETDEAVAIWNVRAVIDGNARTAQRGNRNFVPSF
jgi:hypothetical protein